MGYSSDRHVAESIYAKCKAIAAIALQEKQRADRMAARLTSLGINPDEI